MDLEKWLIIEGGGRLFILPCRCRRANSFVIILIYAPVSSRRVPTPDTFSRPKYPPLVHTEGGGKEQRSRVSLRRGIFSIIPSSEGTRDQARNTQDCRVTPGSAMFVVRRNCPINIHFVHSKGWNVWKSSPSRRIRGWLYLYFSRNEVKRRERKEGLNGCSRPVLPRRSKLLWNEGGIEREGE